MSKLDTISKRNLEKIRQDIENQYCQEENIEIEQLYEKNNYSQIKKLIGQHLQRKGLGETYARFNIYNKLEDAKDKTNDADIEISREFKNKVNLVLGDHYWAILTGEVDSGSTSDAKKHKYRNTRWMYFYYDELDGMPGISTGVMYIDKNNDVFIKDVLQEIPKQVEYEGGMRFILDGSLLIMTLNIKDTKERDLHIALQVGNYGTPPKVMIGQYHNVNNSGTIVSGSLIVQSSKFTIEEFTPHFYEKGSSEYLKIEPTVRRFFNSKNNNRVKIPNTGFTYSNLTKWISQKEAIKRKIAVKHQAPKLFISAPTTSLDSNENYELFKDITSKLTKVLKDKYNVEVLCTLLKFANYEEFRESNILLSEILEELDSCNYFMMILPRLKLKRQSSILLEYGFMLSKPISQIIMVEKGVEDADIPNLLLGAITSRMLTKYNFKNFDDLIKKVERNGLKLFV